jgi:IclR family pca regulon transcriptional regulator
MQYEWIECYNIFGKDRLSTSFGVLPPMARRPYHGHAARRLVCAVNDVEESMSQQSSRKDRLFIEAVGRAFRVLETYSDSAEPRSLAQLASAAGLDKSAVQRVAHTLNRLGYLEQKPGGYVPGSRLLERTFDYLRSNPLVSRAIPILTELRRDVMERVDMSLFDDLSLLYAVRLQSKRDSFYAHLIGRRIPTFCTAGGRAVMALLNDDEVHDILIRSDRKKLTPKTSTEIGEIMEQVNRARETGYATSLEQVYIGELAIAAALRDKDGRPIGAIHVAGSLGEWQLDDFERRVAPLVVAAATAISFN